LDPIESAATKDMKGKGFYEKLEEGKDDPELVLLDKELKDKIFLEGDGLELGKRDQEQFEKLKEAKICSSKYPNICRWKKYVSHISAKK